MSDSHNKFVLDVLIRQNTRLKLSLVFEKNYKDKYPSFSVWVEDVLLAGLDKMEGIE